MVKSIIEQNGWNEQSQLPLARPLLPTETPTSSTPALERLCTDGNHRKVVLHDHWYPIIFIFLQHLNYLVLHTLIL